jgi:hypothetical protein
MIMAVEASIVSRARERAMDTSECVGCKLVMPAHPGPTHRYIRCSPECWSLFGEVLAREFQNQRLFRAVHQVTVDTYAVQHAVDHPAKSLTCHLVSLFAILGRSQMQDEDADTLVRFVQGRAKFPRLEAPADMGPMTIFDVGPARLGCVGARTPHERVRSTRSPEVSLWQATHSPSNRQFGRTTRHVVISRTTMDVSPDL